jgi:hypothetical protein
MYPRTTIESTDYLTAIIGMLFATLRGDPSSDTVPEVCDSGELL